MSLPEDVRPLLAARAATDPSAARLLEMFTKADEILSEHRGCRNAEARTSALKIVVVTSPVALTDDSEDWIPSLIIECQSPFSIHVRRPTASKSVQKFTVRFSTLFCTTSPVVSPDPWPVLVLGGISHVPSVCSLP